MTGKQITRLQKSFFDSCLEGTKPLEEILDDLNISYMTFVRWMDEREFKSRLHGLRRFLCKARDIQLELSAYRGSGMLARASNDSLKKETLNATRLACVDVIRLSRDSRARRRSQSADEVGRARLLTHPDLPDDEASRLIAELNQDRPKNSSEAPDKSHEA